MNTTTRPTFQARRPLASAERHREPNGRVRPTGRVGRAVEPHPRGTRDPHTSHGRLR